MASVRRDLGQREENGRGRELEDPVNFFTVIVACVSDLSESGCNYKTQAISLSVFLLFVIF